MSNKKTILSLTLGAIVVCMAVAYAAFSTTLTVNGTGTITSTWKVEFDTTITTGTATGDATCSSITYNGLNATLSASLTKPGDKCTYELKIQNKGTLNAVLTEPEFSNAEGCNIMPMLNMCMSTSNHIYIQKAFLSTKNLAANGGSVTLPIVIQYPDAPVDLSEQETASVTISTTATQAA